MNTSRHAKTSHTAAPLTNQHAHEIQAFGSVVAMPIALAENTRRASVDNLNQLLADSITLLPPFTPESIAAGLRSLKVAKLLGGFRGNPAGDVQALTDAILGVARYAAANSSVLHEIDVNPIIVRPAGRGAVAVDALVRLRTLA